MTLAILGILSSIFSEVVSWLNKKLSGTPLQGNAAQILTMIIAFIVGIFYVVSHSIQSVSLTTFFEYCASIYAASQVYYVIIGQWYATKSQ